MWHRINAIVFEDCASVCSVYDSRLATGTNLSQHIDVLKQYDRVFVALDKDATDKAIGMVRTYTRTFRHADGFTDGPKNMERTQRHEFMRSYPD